MKRKTIGIFLCMLMIATVLPVAGTVHDQTGWSVKENTSSEPMSPGLITIIIVARVDIVYDPSNLLGGKIQSNDVMIGKYVYDSGIPDSNPDPTVGQYDFTSSSCGIELRAGGFLFKTNPSDVQFWIQVCNDASIPPGNPPADYYGLFSGKNLDLSNGMVVDTIVWRLIDPGCTSLSTDALPTTAPLVLANWIPYPGLWITGGHPSDPLPFSITANITRAIKSSALTVHDSENNIDIPSETTPYSYPFLRFWVNVFQRFPNTFPLLRHLIGY